MEGSKHEHDMHCNNLIFNDPPIKSSGMLKLIDGHILAQTGYYVNMLYTTIAIMLSFWYNYTRVYSYQVNGLFECVQTY